MSKKTNEFFKIECRILIEKQLISEKDACRLHAKFLKDIGLHSDGGKQMFSFNFEEFYLNFPLIFFLNSLSPEGVQLSIGEYNLDSRYGS